MKTTQAFNFFLVGLGMFFSPACWPDLFADDVNRNASELWLLIMGGTQMLFGAWIAGVNEVPRLVHFLTEWEPVMMDFAPPDVSWALPESFYAGLDDDDVGVGLNLQQQLRMSPAQFSQAA